MTLTMRPHRALLLLAAAALTLPLRSHIAAPLPATSRMERLPRVTLWSWERREDLSHLNPSGVAVAALRETLTQDGPLLRIAPQRNALFLPPDITRIAVVRLETHQPVLTPETAAAIAKELAHVAAASPGIAAFQIDFDAKLSERTWYRAVLQQTRAQLPQSLPLSITALASWCSDDRWMQGLPIDEAVPMLFRMEPVTGPDYNIALREPLCQGSRGVSTTEPWPHAIGGRRVYVFPDRGWRRDETQLILKALHA